MRGPQQQFVQEQPQLFLAGDQTYPVAPLPFNVVVFPIHIATGGPASTVGKGFTVTVTTAVEVQVPCVAVTV